MESFYFFFLWFQVALGEISFQLAVFQKFSWQKEFFCIYGHILSQACQFGYVFL